MQQTASTDVLAREVVTSRPVRFPQRDKRQLVHRVDGRSLVVSVRETAACRVQRGVFVTTEQTVTREADWLMWTRLGLIAAGGALMYADQTSGRLASCNRSCGESADFKLYTVIGFGLVVTESVFVIRDLASLGTKRTRTTALVPGPVEELTCGDTAFRGALVIRWSGGDGRRTEASTADGDEVMVPIPDGAEGATVSTPDGVVGVIDLPRVP